MARLTDAYLNGEVPKIKTNFAEIIVRGQTEKPYYNIMFIDPQTREYEVCFGSYCLENVRKWLSDEFEIVDVPTVDAVPVVHGRWIELPSMAPEYECSECGQSYEWWEVTEAHYCPNCGAHMDLEVE